MIHYLAFWLGSKLAPRVPVAWGFAAASLLGLLAYYLVPGARRVVLSNLSRVLGEDTAPDQLARTARAVFVNGARNYFDLLRLTSVRVEELDRRVTINGLEHLNTAMAQGQGVVLVTAHMGNWDLVGQCLRQLYPGQQAIIPVEPIRPEPLLRLVTRLRASGGVTFVPLGVGSLRVALQGLRRGDLVAMAADRDIQGNGLKMVFFGRETTMPVGVLELARRTGAAIVPAFCIREKDNRFTAYVEPPLAVEWQEGSEAELRSNMLKLVAMLERYLRRYPEQWVVFQPIWPGEGGRLGVPGNSHFVASHP